MCLAFQRPFRCVAVLATIALAYIASCSSGSGGGGSSSGRTTSTSSSGGSSSSATTATTSSGTTSSSSGGSTSGCLSPTFSITPPTQVFGSVEEGTSSAAVTFTVTSTLCTTSTVSLTLSGANASDFSLSVNTCTDPLGTGQTCTVAVTFSPSGVGSEAATLSATTGAGVTASSALSGTGLPVGSAQLSVTPSSFAFPNLCISQVSGPETFTLTNIGAAATGTPSVAMFGGDATQFQIADGGNGCTAPVASAGSCSVSVIYDPTSVGAASSQLQFAASPGGTVAASVTGSAAGCMPMAISPAAGAFGLIIQGTTSSAIVFTVTNESGATLGAVQLSITGVNAVDFEANSTTCTGPLAPLGSCTASVTFIPSTGGPESATLVATAGNGGSVQASLTGQGCVPGSPLTVAPGTPAFLDFGDTNVGQTSAPLTVTLEDTSSCASAGTLSVSVSPAEEFAIPDGGDGCTSLGPGQSCTVSVAFTPTDAGAFQGNLVINGTQGAVAAVALSGTGVDP